MILAFITDDYNTNSNVQTSCCARTSVEGILMREQLDTSGGWPTLQNGTGIETYEDLPHLLQLQSDVTGEVLYSRSHSPMSHHQPVCTGINSLRTSKVRTPHHEAQGPRLSKTCHLDRYRLLHLSWAWDISIHGGC
jgi:hypothetical protein